METGKERWPASFIWISKCKHTYTHTSNIHSKPLDHYFLFIYSFSVQVQISQGTINTVNIIRNDVRTREETTSGTFLQQDEKKERKKEREERPAKKKSLKDESIGRFFKCGNPNECEKSWRLSSIAFLPSSYFLFSTVPCTTKKLLKFTAWLYLTRRRMSVSSGPSSLSFLNTSCQRNFFSFRRSTSICVLSPFEQTLFLFFLFLHRSLSERKAREYPKQDLLMIGWSDG